MKDKFGLCEAHSIQNPKTKNKDCVVMWYSLTPDSICLSLPLSFPNLLPDDILGYFRLIQLLHCDELWEKIVCYNTGFDPYSDGVDPQYLPLRTY